MAGYPQIPAASKVVLTLIPLEKEAGIGGPRVTPPRVTTYAPAAKVLPTPIDMEDVETEDTVSNRPGAVAVVEGAAVVAALVVAAAVAQENGSAVVVGGASVEVSYWYWRSLRPFLRVLGKKTALAVLVTFDPITDNVPPDIKELG
jgi:hypothetical protein